MIDEPTARIIVELPTDRPLVDGETVTVRIPLGAEPEGIRAAVPVEVVAQEKWAHPDQRERGYFLLLEDAPGFTRLQTDLVRDLLTKAGYTRVD